MTAYIVLIRNETHDPEGMKAYAALAPKAPIDQLEIAAAKTNWFEVLEGEEAEAVVILKFPDRKAANRWYRSPEYQAAVKHRLASGSYRTVMVEGVDTA